MGEWRGGSAWAEVRGREGLRLTCWGFLDGVAGLRWGEFVLGGIETVTSDEP